MHPMHTYIAPYIQQQAWDMFINERHIPRNISFEPETQTLVVTCTQTSLPYIEHIFMEYWPHNNILIEYRVMDS